MPFKECSVDGCSRQAVSRGWCHGHYQRWIRLGDVMPDRPLGRQVNFACSVDGCDRDAYARQLCRTHYRRRLNTGDERAGVPVREVSGKGFLHHGYFVVPVPPSLRHLTNGESPTLQHRLVMAQMLGRPLFPDESVHHRNGDRLDNRPENLELWSRWQPRGQRTRDKVAFAVALLKRYAPRLVRPSHPRRVRTEVTGQLALPRATPDKLE